MLAGEKLHPHTPQDRRRLLPISPVDRTAPEVAPRQRLESGPLAPLKLASGCDRRCSFCAIPTFRGAFVSRRPSDVLLEARWLAGEGVRELFLVSENTTSYGKDLGDLRLLETLLPEVAAVDGVERVRVSYLQPAEIRPGLLEAIATTAGRRAVLRPLLPARQPVGAAPDAPLRRPRGVPRPARAGPRSGARRPASARTSSSGSPARPRTTSPRSARSWRRRGSTSPASSATPTRTAPRPRRSPRATSSTPTRCGPAPSTSPPSSRSSPPSAPRSASASRSRVLVEDVADADGAEGRADHQGPEVDGTTRLVEGEWRVGDLVPPSWWGPTVSTCSPGRRERRGERPRARQVEQLEPAQRAHDAAHPARAALRLDAARPRPRLGAAGAVSRFGVFVVAMATDKIDGDIARARNLITDFGKIADPIADKALTGMALVALSIMGDVWWWVTILVLVREWAVTLLRLSVAKTVVIAAAASGKWKTTSQAVALSLLTLPLRQLDGSLDVVGDVVFYLGAGVPRGRRRADAVVGLRVLPGVLASAPHPERVDSVTFRRVSREFAHRQETRVTVLPLPRRITRSVSAPCSFLEGLPVGVHTRLTASCGGRFCDPRDDRLVVLTPPRHCPRAGQPSRYRPGHQARSTGEAATAAPPSPMTSSSSTTPPARRSASTAGRSSGAAPVAPARPRASPR